MSKPEALLTKVGLCTVKRSSRKTLAISVLPDGQIELRAPKAATRDAIVAKVEKRAKWITSKRWEFSQLNVTRPKLSYQSGASHRYLGRQYRLKVQKCRDESVKLKGAYIYVCAPSPSAKRTKSLLDLWFREAANRQFSRRLKGWKDWCRRNELPEPVLQLRAMSKRWGSVSEHGDGKILLNPDLVRTPSICIDYVIAHEVCHLKVPKHDQRFFRLLSEVFPSWKEVKQRLEQAEF